MKSAEIHEPAALNFAFFKRNNMRSRSITFKIVEKRLFVAFAAALLILATLYGYFLVSSIVNVIVREEAEQKTVALSSELSNVEYAYIERQNAITIAFAHSLGFTNIKDKQFVTRQSVLGRGLTFGDDIR